MKVDFLINFEVLLSTKYSEYHLKLEVNRIGMNSKVSLAFISLVIPCIWYIRCTFRIQKLPLEIHSNISNVRNTSCSTLDKWFLHFILRELKLFAK